MRLIIQRVREASVTADEAIVGRIEEGLLVLVGLHRQDTTADADELAKKLLSLRLFPTPETRWTNSLLDLPKHKLLLVSQFTLYASTEKGAKLDFHAAMSGPEAQVLFNYFVDKTKAALGDDRVYTGAFGRYMQIALVNDGPVTVTLESRSYLRAPCI